MQKATSEILAAVSLLTLVINILIWLEEGEPYEESEDTILRLLKAEFSLDEIDVEIIKMYLQLTPEERAVLKRF